MREATSKTGHLWFTLISRRSQRHPPIKMSDLDFADDITLTLDTLQEAQNLLSSVEIEAANVGLHLNATKPEMITYNQQGIADVGSLNGELIKNVNDFKVSRPLIDSTIKDINVRKHGLHAINFRKSGNRISPET